ncbi:probable serine/threonine-protein kinase clkA isoform X6 [Adelges cooleyi]|uniref:probable serine/threonine-protein kinase clkA isoform X6 n=1 Tax=Adelges cooleyi TaxID=133065 RepID=UPI00217FE41E|nr:probable serine/threonine-protein kinase clkA isoform X6 [Adelges cooleyi]
MKILLFSIILLSATMGFCQGRNSINIEIDGNHHVNMANGPDNNSVAKTESPTNTYGIEDNIFEFDLRDKNSSDRPPHINIYYKSGVTNRENRPPHIHIYCPCGVDGPENNRRPPPLDFYIAGENEYSQRQDPLNNSGAKTESPTNTYGVEENIFEFDLRGENSRDRAPHINIYYVSVVFGTGNNRAPGLLHINIYYQPGVLGPENSRANAEPPSYYHGIGYPPLPVHRPSGEDWNNYNPNFLSQPWPNPPSRNSRTSAEQPTNSYGMGGNDNNTANTEPPTGAFRMGGTNINRNPQSPPLGPSGEHWNNNMNNINPNFPWANTVPPSYNHGNGGQPPLGPSGEYWNNHTNNINPNFPMGNYRPSNSWYNRPGVGGTDNNSQPWPNPPSRNSRTSAEQPTSSYGMGGNDNNKANTESPTDAFRMGGTNINRNPQSPPLGPSGEHWNNNMNNINPNFPWANTVPPSYNHGNGGQPPLGPSGEHWNNHTNNINPNFPMGNYRPSNSWYNGPPLPVHGTNDPEYVNYINRVYPGSNFPVRNNGQSTNAYYGSGFGGFVNNSQPWPNNPYQNSWTNTPYEHPANSYQMGGNDYNRAHTEPPTKASELSDNDSNRAHTEPPTKASEMSDNDSNRAHTEPPTKASGMSDNDSNRAHAEPPTDDFGFGDNDSNRVNTEPPTAAFEMVGNDNIMANTESPTDAFRMSDTNIDRTNTGLPRNSYEINSTSNIRQRRPTRNIRTNTEPPRNNYEIAGENNGWCNLLLNILGFGVRGVNNAFNRWFNRVNTGPPTNIHRTDGTDNNRSITETPTDGNDNNSHPQEPRSASENRRNNCNIM